MYSKIRGCSTAIFLAIWVICGSTVQAQTSRQIDRATTEQKIRALCWLTETPVNSEQLHSIIGGESNQFVSWSDIQSSVKQLGLPLVSHKLTLQQLRKRGGAALVRLSNPEQFLVVSGIGKTYAVCVENDNAYLVSLSEISQRYTGELLSLPISQRITLGVKNPMAIGKVTASGQEVDLVVPITNKGKVPIDLDVEKTSCTCTTSGDSVRRLESGQTGNLRFKVHATGWGTRTVSATIRTSDPAWPRFFLILQVAVPPSILPNPNKLEVRGFEGQSAERKATLLLPSKAALIKVGAKSPFITTKLVRTDVLSKDMKSYHVAVTVKENAPVGKFSDEVVFELKNASVPRVGIPIDGIVEADIAAEPGQVFWGRVKSGSPLSKMVRIYSASGKDFSIKGIESDNKKFEVKTSLDKMASTATMEIQGAANGEIGSAIRDTVRVHLSNGSVIQIPLFALVASTQTETTIPGKQEASKLPRAEDDPMSSIASPQPLIKVGEALPPFKTVDMNGVEWKLEELEGKKNLLLTFFPKCFTGGCANHLSSLRDKQADFDATSTQILAVSVDQAEGERGQKAFAQQWRLKFPLIPDTDRSLSILYGAAQDSKQLTGRMTILVDKQGIIRYIDTDVNVETHGIDMLTKIEEFGF